MENEEKENVRVAEIVDEPVVKQPEIQPTGGDKKLFYVAAAIFLVVTIYLLFRSKGG